MNDTFVYNIIITYLFLDFILRLIDKFQVKTKNVTIFESTKTNEDEDDDEISEQTDDTEDYECDDESSDKSNDNETPESNEECDGYQLEFEDTETISTMPISDDI